MSNTSSIIVNNIKWDRIWIYFHTIALNSAGFNLQNAPEIFLTNKSGTYSAKLIYVENGIYKLNITNPGNCHMLPIGVYQLRAYGYDVILNNELVDNLFNRKFIYFHSEKNYKVQFSSKHGLRLKISDGMRTDISTHKSIISKLRTTKNNLAKAVLRTIYRIEYILFHRKRKKNILLMSDQSESLGSNLLALKEALLSEGYNPDEALRAITTKHYSLMSWIKTLRKIASANYIFLDDHSQTTDWLKIQGATITQIWHAGAGFKSVGYSRFGLPASPAPVSGHRQYTYGIAGSKKIRHFFSEVWGINDSMVLPTGMPRLDKYIDASHQANVINQLHTDYPVLCKPNNEQLILFAPTYRGENKKHAYYPYDMLDMDQLYKLCISTNSIFIFKMHPFITEPVPIPDKYSDRIIDMSDYPDINDLFYVTDLLITDYSSNIYEFSLMKKPMLFFAYDIAQYSRERGFHRDYYSSVPGRIVRSFDQMCDAIRTREFAFEKVQKYLDESFDYIDSNACSRIIDWIIRGNMPKEILEEIENEKTRVSTR